MSLHSRIVLAVLIAGIAAPASALSCLRPDLARTYRQAAEAEETFVVIHGRLDFDESRLPEVDMTRQNDTPPDTLIPARLSGKSLSRKGFERPFERRIMLNAQCFGPWCATPVPGTDYLAFLERTDRGYVLRLDPCGGMGFAEPTPDMLEKVTACFRGGACEPEEP